METDHLPDFGFRVLLGYNPATALEADAFQREFVMDVGNGNAQHTGFVCLFPRNKGCHDQNIRKTLPVGQGSFSLYVNSCSFSS
jgi:hypothetical protein